MALDVMILGPFVFTDFAVPDRLPFGGKQHMTVHKMPGGSRVIDCMGPDDDDRSWSGILWGDDALAEALTLDAMRRAGEAPSLFRSRQELRRHPVRRRFHRRMQAGSGCTSSPSRMGKRRSQLGASPNMREPLSSVRSFWTFPQLSRHRLSSMPALTPAR